MLAWRWSLTANVGGTSIIVEGISAQTCGVTFQLHPFSTRSTKNKDYLLDVRRVCWRTAADSPGLDVPPQLHLGDKEGRHQFLCEGRVDRHRNLNVSTPQHRQASNSKAKTCPLKMTLLRKTPLFHGCPEAPAVPTSLCHQTSAAVVGRRGSLPLGRGNWLEMMDHKRTSGGRWHSFRHGGFPSEWPVFVMWPPAPSLDARAFQSPARRPFNHQRRSRLALTVSSAFSNHAQSPGPTLLLLPSNDI